MFKSNLLRIAPSLRSGLVENAVAKSVQLTAQKLYIYSEERISPELISRIYKRQDQLDLYFLCCGIPLKDYTEIDDIDLYLSPVKEDRKYLSSLQDKVMHWKRTRFMHLELDHVPEDSNIPADGNPGDVFYEYGALGGTFDDLHVGHKLLLTSASVLSRNRLLVGLTHDDLLKNKHLVELLEPYKKRKQMVEKFVKTINPQVQLNVVPISDPIGPAGTDADMDVLVVSEETAGGTEKINSVRSDNGLKLLSSYSVDLIIPEESTNKVSSSFKRKYMLSQLLERHPKPWLKHRSREHYSGKRPYVVGLTGGICSGKSTISEYIKPKEHVGTIDCDKVGHQVYQPGQVAYTKLIEEFGECIVNEDSTINRKELGKIVFSDKSQMKKLTGIVWPCIADEVRKLIESSDCDLIVVEAAVMLEAGWQSLVDEVWVMTVSPVEAIKRLSSRNGLSDEDAKKRLQSQMTNTERCSSADLVICSDWEPEVTQGYLDRAWLGLQERMKYYEICRSGSSIEERWTMVSAVVCESTKDSSWLTHLCRTEKSRAFLEISLCAVDETLDQCKGKHMVFYAAFYFISTTLHIKNMSLRAIEAMFTMFCEGNDIQKESADEIMKYIRTSSTLLKKPVACSEIDLLFCDIWMKATIHCPDEGDQRILPSIFTTEDVAKEQDVKKCELLLRLLEGNKFIYKTEYFRKTCEDISRKRIEEDLETLKVEDRGAILTNVRTSIGYNLQEY